VSDASGAAHALGYANETRWAPARTGTLPHSILTLAFVYLVDFTYIHT
jgi:hypothetical protein